MEFISFSPFGAEDGDQGLNVLDVGFSDHSYLCETVELFNTIKLFDVKLFQLNGIYHTIKGTQRPEMYTLLIATYKAILLL